MAAMNRSTAITIGNFDGVHVGHRALVQRARKLAGPADSGGRVIALAFDPHPFTRLKPEAAPALLTTFEHRSELLRQAGADDVVRLEPTTELLSLSAEQFVDWLVERFHPRVVVEGTDFHFGKQRAGNISTLSTLGTIKGYRVEIVPPVEVSLSDQLIVRASSSLVRWLLGHGRVADAAIVLARPYELHGVVERGDRRGRVIGFPTANIRCGTVLPADGVYAGSATLPDGRVYAAAINIGTRPTFNGIDRRCEAHIIGTRSGSEPSGWLPIIGLPEYDWPLILRLDAWLRDDLRFDSVTELTGQIRRDCERVMNTVRIAC